MTSPKKYSTIAVVVILAIISLVIFSFNLKSPEKMSLFRKVVLEAVVPLESAVNSVFGSVTGVWRKYVLLVGAQTENERLKAENASLAREVSDYREMTLACARLRKLMDIKSDLKFPTIAARVVGKNRSSVFKTVLIDKGALDGIQTGFPVMGTGGIVGRVMDTSWNTSKILLLIDYNSNIASLIQRNRCQGILRGYGNSGCELKYIQRSEDVKPGDTVVSSGLAGIFPRGLLVGKVVEVEKGEAGLFQKIAVRPAVDIARMEEVLVILKDTENRK